MVNNQLKNIKKKRSLVRKKNTFEKKKQVSTEFCQVARVTGQPSGSTKFDCFFALVGLSPYPDYSSNQIDLSSRSKFNHYARNC